MTTYFPSAKSKILGIVLWGIILAGFGISIFVLVQAAFLMPKVCFFKPQAVNSIFINDQFH